MRGEGGVEYADSSGAGSVAAEVREHLPGDTGMAFPYYTYEAVLRGLNPESEYGYRVLLDGVPVTRDLLRFRTPGHQAFRFLAFGDSGMGTDAQAKIAHRMRVHGGKLVLHTGDLVYPTGTYERYEALYFRYYQEMMAEVPFFPCPGNHDYYEFRCVPYRSVHSVPGETVPPADVGRYYSFDWGNVHFVSLDSNESLDEAVRGSGRMLEWLDRDLGETLKFWRIVYFHHPAYSAGPHRFDQEVETVRKYIVPILEKHAVPLVISGHDHNYQRSFPISNGTAVNSGHGTVHVVTGGGGATLHPVYESQYMAVGIDRHHYVSCDVNGARAFLKAISTDGEELDRHTIAPRPVVQDEGVVNAASFTRAIAPGGLVSVFGAQLCPDEYVPVEYPLPTSVLGVSVLVKGRELPILMASPRQINVVMPLDVEGAAELTVQTPNGIATAGIVVAEVAPALFPDAVFHHNGVQVSRDAPAAAGETLAVYLTGLGRAGQAPAVALAGTRVRLGSQIIEPLSVSEPESLAGVNILRFQVPAGIRGALPLSVLVGTAVSNGVSLHVAA